jgi:tetratricopeptide (TPR) repeat protein
MAKQTDYLAQGVRFLRDNRPEDALRAFDKVLRHDPSQKRALIHRAEALTKLNRLEEALRSYDKAVEIDPKEAQFWISRGDVLEHLKRLEEALQSYDKAVEIDPKEAWAWLWRGDVLRNLKKPEEALQSYDKAVEIDPKEARFWVSRGHVLGDLKRSEEALRSYEKATQIDPQLVWGWIWRGHLLEALRRPEEALQSYEKATEVDPKEVWSWIWKGDVLAELKRPEEALQTYDKAIDVNPGEFHAWLNRGQFLTSLQRIPEALNDFGQALDRAQAQGDVELEKLVQSWIQDLRRRMEEQKAKKEPPIEVKILRRVREQIQRSSDEDPFKRIKEREEDYRRYFNKPRTIRSDESFLAVLRRWNSFTPKIPNREDGKNGGGYFLVWGGKGVVIDPGFDFMDNFDRAGFSLRDIDAVILTHAHTDHTADFEALLCLKHEERERLGEEVKVDLFMNLGSLHKFIGWISRLDVVRNLVALNPGDVLKPQGYEWTLKPTDARHSDVIGDKCLGLVFELGQASGTPLRLGITSDTGWSSRIQSQYRGCKVLCVHLGSIGQNEFDESLPLKGRKRLYGQHLGLIGTISMVKAIGPKLCIISEFGEELGIDRDCIAQTLDRAFDNNKRCLTGDIGLKITLPDIAVQCHVCHHYVDCLQIATEKYGEEMTYHCSSHGTQDMLDWSRAHLR